MPFELVVIDIAKKSPAAQSVKWFARKLNSGVSTTITLPIGVVVDLGWNDTTKLNIMVGTGSDAGQLRLSPATLGSAKLTFRKTHYRVSLGVFQYGPKAAFTPTGAAHVISGGVLTLSCPILKETAPTPKPAEYKGMR